MKNLREAVAKKEKSNLREAVAKKEKATATKKAAKKVVGAKPMKVKMVVAAKSIEKLGLLGAILAKYDVVVK